MGCSGTVSRICLREAWGLLGYHVHYCSLPRRINYYYHTIPYQYSIYDYALVSMTPRLITSSTSQRGFFHVPLNETSFEGRGGDGEQFDMLSSYNVSESLKASDLTELEAVTVFIACTQ